MARTTKEGRTHNGACFVLALIDVLPICFFYKTCIFNTVWEEGRLQNKVIVQALRLELLGGMFMISVWN